MEGIDLGLAARPERDVNPVRGGGLSAYWISNRQPLPISKAQKTFSLTKVSL
jgi:hypothetical protein